MTLSKLSPLLAFSLLSLYPANSFAGFASFDGIPVTQGEMRIQNPHLMEGRTDTRDHQSVARRLNKVDRMILEETRVNVEISGVIARVQIDQVFVNPYEDRLEAIYVFPLPEDAGVDRYSFQIDERIIQGVVKERDEARRIYERARSEGRKAALLEQERANVFTQSVANIPAKKRITVHIEYVHPLKVSSGNYSFRFPMVVAPRFMPGTTLERANVGRGWKRDTDQVPDASRISARRLPDGQRLGNDIHIAMHIDAGMPIQDITAVTHEIDTDRPDETTAVVTLRSNKTVANKDFVIEYGLASEQPVVAALSHRKKGSQHGYLSLIVQPKRETSIAELAPREVILLLDKSGSMRGRPISQMRIMAQHILGGLNPQDRFRLVAFDNKTHEFRARPLEATPQNVAKGQTFIRNIASGSGTNLLPAMKVAIGGSIASEKEGLPCYLILLSDALVGNDDAILGCIRSERFRNIRIFPVAIGPAPNHYLTQRAAELGRGFAMHVTNQDNAVAMAERFNKKTSSPYLTDLQIDWAGLSIKDMIPPVLPDLYAGEPLVIFARYETTGKAGIRIRGNFQGKEVQSHLDLELPEEESKNDALATIWARQRIRQIWNENVGSETLESRTQIRMLGLEHQLVTRYTSFVAVESSTDDLADGQLVSRDVPSLLPEGMSRAPGRRVSRHSAPTMQAPTGQAPTRQAPRSQPAPSRNTPADDPGRGFGGLGGGGGGAVEWVFILGAGLLGGGRQLSRRRRREGNTH